MGWLIRSHDAWRKSRKTYYGRRAIREGVLGSVAVGLAAISDQRVAFRLAFLIVGLTSLALAVYMAVQQRRESSRSDDG